MALYEFGIAERYRLGLKDASAPDNVTSGVGAPRRLPSKIISPSLLRLDQTSPLRTNKLGF